MRIFKDISYMGGHPALPRPCPVAVEVNETTKRITIYQGMYMSNTWVRLIPEEIITISLDEKSKRSLGKAAAGAIIGGVLTGGIGLVAGGLFGGRKKNDSIVYIIVTLNNREHTIMLKAGKQADQIYAMISSIL